MYAQNHFCGNLSVKRLLHQDSSLHTSSNKPFSNNILTIRKSCLRWKLEICLWPNMPSKGDICGLCSNACETYTKILKNSTYPKFFFMLRQSNNFLFRPNLKRSITESCHIGLGSRFTFVLVAQDSILVSTTTTLESREWTLMENDLPLMVVPYCWRNMQPSGQPIV